MQLISANSPSNKYVFTNFTYCHLSDFIKISSEAGRNYESDDLLKQLGLLVMIKGQVFSLKPHQQPDLCTEGLIQMNNTQRAFINLAAGTSVKVNPFFPPEKHFILGELSFSIQLLKKSRDSKPIEVDCEELQSEMKTFFFDHVFSRGQSLIIKFQGILFKIETTSMSPIVLEGTEENGEPPIISRGQLSKLTSVAFQNVSGSGTPIKLKGGGGGRSNQLFERGFNFNAMGIGGLDKEFANIFRRAFASRVFPSDVIQKMGLNHVRGMLLYGPPGCGKTLIARKIGKALNAHEPKVVNGPEVLNKYVGGSEEKIRELFADAETEQREMGDSSELHIIIFDEIDAICKSRGSTSDGTGVHDSVVNQLLSKIDGVESLNNVLIIGMTNRKDMLDEAILRPGRLEVHVEIGLPDRDGRIQILDIHTQNMRKSGYLADDVDIGNLATHAKNFTGAEIESLVKAASAYAFERQVDINNLGKVVDYSAMRVTQNDFHRALSEVIPKFGAKVTDLEAAYRMGFIHHGPGFDALMTTLRRLVNQVRESSKTPLLSVLLEGPPGVGKTALACKLAQESGYPFVKLISAEELLGYTGYSRAGKIVSAFDDAHKSDLSIVIIDGIETLLEYVPIGCRVSNPVLQALLVLVKKVPSTPGRRVLVIGTTSISTDLRALSLLQCFNIVLNVPEITSHDEIKTVLQESGYKISAEDTDVIAKSILDPIPVKRLLLLLEMAAIDNAVEAERFVQCLMETSH